MRYLSERLSWALFATGVAVLIALGVITDLMARRLVASEKSIAHTHEVNSALSQLHNDVLRADSARLRYIYSNDKDRLPRARAAMSRVAGDFTRVQQLTADNSQQRADVEQLETALKTRMELLEESLTLRESGKPDTERQVAITAAGGNAMYDVAATLASMHDREEALLDQRQMVSEKTYTQVRLVIAGAFVVGIAFLTLSFRQLVVELRDRRLAQQSVRRLSARVLELQDMERRKIARELHDSIGQYFAGMAMMLDTIRYQPISPERRDAMLAESVEMAQQGAAETRTLSHLLHPPLLDERGFASAARWYVDGYRERSKIDVEINIDGEMEELPKEIALALFRALQEGLTNIHRHSGSKTARVEVKTAANRVAMTLTDQGKGIPEAMLEQFRMSQSAGGIGLAGLRERIAELGGTLELESGTVGTTLKIELPGASRSSSSEAHSGPEANTARQLDSKKAGAVAPANLKLLGMEA